MLKSITIEEPELLNNLRIKSDSVRSVDCSKRFGLIKTNNINKVKNLDFIKGCPNLARLIIDSVDVECWDEIYNFEKLMYIWVDEENFKRIDLSKFSSEPIVNESHNFYTIEFPDIIEKHRANAKRPK